MIVAMGFAVILMAFLKSYHISFFASDIGSNEGNAK